MNILKIILTVIYAIDCIALTVVVLMQEGKQQGLGSIAGVADTYWGKNKGRDVYKRQRFGRSIKISGKNISIYASALYISQ